MLNTLDNKTISYIIYNMRDELKHIREMAGMSQETLAEEVGLTQVMVSYIESGTRRPSVETAKRIAKVLNIDWTEFFNDDPEEKGA